MTNLKKKTGALRTAVGFKSMGSDFPLLAAMPAKMASGMISQPEALSLTFLPPRNAGPILWASKPRVWVIVYEMLE